MSCYWSDEAYSNFYASSVAEKSLLNRISSKTIDGPSKDQLNKFQEAFAEWSGMRRGGLRCADFRSFLLQLGVDLLPNQARSLWKDFVVEGSQQLNYDQALLAYLQVVGGSVNFSRAPGSVRNVDEHRTQHVDTYFEAEQDSFDDILKRYHASNNSATHDARLEQGRLSLLVGEAREFLLREGLHKPTVETFLGPYLQAGAIPQAALFDFLAEQAGANIEDVFSELGSDLSRRGSIEASMEQADAPSQSLGLLGT